MKRSIVWASVLAMALSTHAWATQYQMPLPDTMAANKTFLDAYTATSTGQPVGVNPWYVETTVWGGYDVQARSRDNGGWAINAPGKVNGAWIQWADVNLTESTSYEVWLSSLGVYDRAVTMTFDVYAGPDADHLTLRSGSGGVVNYSAYNTGVFWSKLGDYAFSSTDKVVTIVQTLNTDSMYYKQSIDELVLATAVPEPATMALLAMGGVAMIRRRA